MLMLSTATAAFGFTGFTTGTAAFGFIGFPTNLFGLVWIVLGLMILVFTIMSILHNWKSSFVPNVCWSYPDRLSYAEIAEFCEKKGIPVLDSRCPAELALNSQLGYQARVGFITDEDFVLVRLSL
jgi:hypothetical protein